MRIALDALGGDSGPEVNVAGAIAAARETGIEVFLIGDADRLEKEVKKQGSQNLPLKICHAPDLIGMGESPAEACKTKPNSSIMVAAKLVANGEADALVSAGNSGATMAASLWHMKRLPGVSRPAIATLIPTLTGLCVLLDVGAMVDCKPKHLFQFAIMGTLYAELIFGIKNPRLGLLSIGEEKTKGNDLTQATHPMLEKSGLNYVGNVEGRDIPKGTVDVVVCDGFVGNIVLKFGEGLAEVLLSLIKKEIKSDPMAMIGGWLAREAFHGIRKKVDYAEYGGAPLLGVNGVSIIAHGGSNAKAIKNAVKLAADFVRKNLNREITESIHQHVSVQDAAQPLTLASHMSFDRRNT